MSAAAAETVESDGDNAPAPKKGKKKLILFVAAAVLLAAGGGGGGFFLWKKKQDAAAQAEAAADADEEGGQAAKPVAKRDTSKTPPAFLPLDAFVVNLADRETERYAQIGITLELEDPKYADQIKAYMPAIRNGILLVLAHKTSKELLTRTGKEKLASEVMREAVKPLGIDLEDENEEATEANGKTRLEDSPIRHVHFSSFIIQ